MKKPKPLPKITEWNAANGDPIAAAEVTDTRTGDGNIVYMDWP